MRIEQYENATNMKHLEKVMREINDTDFSLDVLASILTPPSPVPAFEGMKTMYGILVKNFKSGVINYVKKSGLGKNVKFLTDHPFDGTFGGKYENEILIRKGPIAVVDNSKTLELESAKNGGINVLVNGEKVDSIYTIWDIINSNKMLSTAQKIIAEINKAFEADIKQQIKWMKGERVGTVTDDSAVRGYRTTYDLVVYDFEIHDMTKINKNRDIEFVMASVYSKNSKNVEPYLVGIEKHNFFNRDYTFIEATTYYELYDDYKYIASYDVPYKYRILWYITKNTIVVDYEDWVY